MFNIIPIFTSICYVCLMVLCRIGIDFNPVLWQVMHWLSMTSTIVNETFLYVNEIFITRPPYCLGTGQS